MGFGLPQAQGPECGHNLCDPYIYTPRSNNHKNEFFLFWIHHVFQADINSHNINYPPISYQQKF